MRLRFGDYLENNSHMRCRAALKVLRSGRNYGLSKQALEQQHVFVKHIWQLDQSRRVDRRVRNNRDKSSWQSHGFLLIEKDMPYGSRKGDSLVDGFGRLSGTTGL